MRLSTEEADVLARTNNINPPDITSTTVTSSLNVTSTYLHKLITNPANPALQNYTSNCRPLYESNLMDELDNPKEGAAFIPISTQDKQHIYQRCARALIIG